MKAVYVQLAAHGEEVKKLRASNIGLQQQLDNQQSETETRLQQQIQVVIIGYYMVRASQSPDYSNKSR